jgi:hypothetical protein
VERLLAERRAHQVVDPDLLLQPRDPIDH